MKKLLLMTLLLGINSFSQETNTILVQATTDFKKLESDFTQNNQEHLTILEKTMTMPSINYNLVIDFQLV